MTRLKNANMLLALFLGLAALNASAEKEKNNGRQCEVGCQQCGRGGR